MYARMITVQSQPSKRDEAISIYQEVVPAIKEQKGFKSLLLLTDAATGKGVSITLWETEADMTAGEASGKLQQVLTRFGDVLTGPPVTERFEVSVQA